MRISCVEITNFRALKKIEIELSSFGCVIGENNAGKSSLLQALLRFCEPRVLPKSDYYDPNQSVRVKVTFEKVTEKTFELIRNDEHRSRIKELLIDDKLKLVRVFPPGERPELKCCRLVPKDVRLREDVVDKKLKGKSGVDLENVIAQNYPELIGKIGPKLSQASIKDAIARLRSQLKREELIEEEVVLPTGIPQSISTLIPEPIYIPAVKNLSDEYKTIDSATFGKILNLLLKVIEPQLEQEKELFDQLEKKFNKTGESDERLDEIKLIEGTIEKNLRENFPLASVTIRIPPPDLKTILQGARIYIGEEDLLGPVESVGDGLKRSVVFAILRSYVDLRRRMKAGDNEADNSEGRLQYLFLFEEPELYLHPNAQCILFESLSEVAKIHQVLVTTHSPLFFSGDATKTFAKLVKLNPTIDESKPVSALYQINLENEISLKDTFRLICYENNNAAFFATDVVLVEGDSDFLAYRHIAKLINPAWDFDRGKVMMVRVGGKGNFKRYKSFFKRFNIRTYILTDLDFIVRGFDKAGIPADHPVVAKRQKLIEDLDSRVAAESLSGKEVRKLFERLSWREKWMKFISVARGMIQGHAPSNEDIDLLELMLEEELYQPRLEGLKSCQEIQGAKLQLLKELRKLDVFVLSKGSIEDYYPKDATGSDKTTKAENFRKLINSSSEALALADNVPSVRGGDCNEFEEIFSIIFEEKVVATVSPDDPDDVGMQMVS